LMAAWVPTPARIHSRTETDLGPCPIIVPAFIMRIVKTVDRRTGIEVLDHDQCLSLLSTEDVGRLAVISAGVPIILPINYVLDGDTIVFRTAAGTKFEEGQRHRVSFEVDRFDRDEHSGWSIVVTGRVEEVTDRSRDFGRLQQLDLDPWSDHE